MSDDIIFFIQTIKYCKYYLQAINQGINSSPFKELQKHFFPFERNYCQREKSEREVREGRAYPG